MYIVDQPTFAVILCLLTMLCWGSWNNGQKIVTQSAPLYIFYRDYVYGIAGTSLLLALTLGSLGEDGRSFREDLQQATFQYIAMAFAAGILFNLGNTLLTVGINLAGLSIAMPIGTGLSLALGLIVNYLAEPEGNVTLLAIGGGLVLVSIACCAFAYRAKNAEEDESDSDNKGIWIALTGGFIQGFFFLIVTQSIVDDLALPESKRLTPYTAFLLFAIGILVSNPLIEKLIKRFEPSQDGPQPSYREADKTQHLWGLGSGIIWAIGMMALLLGSQEAGGAVSYGLSQGATIVSVLWGLFAWKEFKDAPAKANRFLWLMGATYISGLIIIILARAQA